MQRKFTYINDIVEVAEHILDQTAIRYSNCNIGNHTPVELMTLIQTIESALGIEAKKNFLPLQNGDVGTTYTDIATLKQAVDFEPKTELAEANSRRVNWYKACTSE